MANRVHPAPASFTQLEGKPSPAGAPPTPTQNAIPDLEQPPPSRIPVEEECEPPVPLSRGDSSPRIWTGRKKTLRGVPLQEAAVAAAALGAGATAAPLNETEGAGVEELERDPSRDLGRSPSKGSLVRADSLLRGDSFRAPSSRANSSRSLGDDGGITGESSPSAFPRSPHHSQGGRSPGHSRGDRGLMEPPVLLKGNSDRSHNSSARGFGTESDQVSLREVLRLQYVRSVVVEGAALQRKIGPVQREIARSSTINIFHTNSPIASALSKRWFQIMLLLLGASYLGRVVLAAEELRRHAYTEAARYRFTALELRSGAVTDGAWAGAAEWEFGVMLDHCQHGTAEPLGFTTEGASQTISFPAPVRMNGWFFVTSESDDPELDPVKFSIAAEVEDGKWEEVGASLFRRTGFGEVRFLSSASFDTPTRRGATVKVDMRPAWEWYIGWMCSDVLIASGMIMATALGVYGLEINGKMCFELTWVLSFFFRVAPAISYLSSGQYRHCFEWWSWAVFSLLFPLGLALAERSFITVVLLAGILLIVVQAVNETLLFQEDEWFSRSPPYLGITLCVLGSFFLLFRMYIVGRSRRFITEDKRVYDSVWETLLEEPEMRSALVELKSVSAEIQHLIRSNNCHARQYNRQSKGYARDSPNMRSSAGRTNMVTSPSRGPPRTDSTINVMGETYRSRTGLAIEPGWVTRNLNIFQFLKGSIIYPIELSIPGSIDEKRPVRSLDQLYAQAAGMNVVLKGKVQQWALRCNGMFQLKNLRPAIFVRWADAVSDEQMRRRIKWGEIKTYNRAIEKLLRSYRSNVSLLCDLCRQTIVFEDLNELIACLYAIGSDKQIVVVRIKNRLDQHYDARMTAGHRSVVLNVRVVTRETKRLGLETHVSEVQLVLRQLQELQTEEAHERYIQFRNNYPYKRQEPSHLYEDMVAVVTNARRGSMRRRTSLLSTDSLRAADGLRRLSLSSQEGVGTHERREEGGSVVIQTQRQVFQVSAQDSNDQQLVSASSGLSELERDDSSDAVTPTGAGSAEASEIAPSSSDGRRGLAPIEEISSDEADETMSLRSHQSKASNSNVSGASDAPSRVDSGDGGGDTFDLQALFEAQYVKSTVQEHGTMEIRKSRVNDAMALVSTESVFFTSKAAVAAIGKLRWQVVLGLLATLYLYRGIEQSLLSPYGKSGEIKEFSKYRLTALELRGGGSVDAISGPQVSEFGVMLDGCRQTSTEPLETTTEGASQTISFPAPVRMNGWFFVTSQNDPDLDPVRVSLQGRNDGEDDDDDEEEEVWEEVGASKMRVLSTGEVKLLNKGKKHVTKERGAVVEWSLVLPWSWVIAFPVVQMVAVVATYLFILCGITSQSRYANLVLFYGFLLTASLQLTSGIGYALAGNLSEEASYWCLFSLAGFAMATVLAAAERYFILCLTICGVYLILLDVCKNTIMLPDIHGLATSPPFTGIFFVLVGFIANVFHLHILRRSSRLINEDKQRYDAVWEALIADERNTTALKNLTKTIDRVCAIRPAQLRQFNHRKVIDPLIQGNGPKKAPFLNRALSWVSASRQDELKRAVTVNIDSPVQCLDQLFVQGAGMDLILRSKVQAWAAKSQGCFRIKDTTESKPLFFKWKDIKNDPHLRYNVKYGRLKGIDRAIEKLLRSYAGDVSLLLDVCRQSIVFDEIRDMTRCIHIIAEDADVAVARIKNRYDLEADSEATAGYRQVVLNLRIRTDLAKSLALETHVCEVQLLLRQFAEIKDDEHHGRYIKFRNARGE